MFFAEQEVAKDVNTGRGWRMTTKLDIEAGTATRTVPGRRFRELQLIEKRPRLGNTPLEHHAHQVSLR